MIIERNKIVEATEEELFDYYLKKGWDDVFSFRTYKELCQENGTKIVDEPTPRLSLAKLRGIIKTAHKAPTGSTEYCIQINDPRGSGRWRAFATYRDGTSRDYVHSQLPVQQALHPGAAFRVAKREVGEWEADD